MGGDRDSQLTTSCLEAARQARAEEVPIALSIIGDAAKLVPEFLNLAEIIICNHFEAQKICDRFNLDGFQNLTKLGLLFVLLPWASRAALSSRLRTL